jgi:hypothetical protein
LAERQYYATRVGKETRGERLDLAGTRRLCLAAYQEFVRRDFFQESMGYDCVDAGHVSGSMGNDPAAFALVRLRRDGLWPPTSSKEYSEEELFTIIEFMHDHVSKVVDGYYHSFSDCGMHGNKFDSATERIELRELINPLLRDYADGWTLSEQGEILRLGPEELTPLLEAPLPTNDPKNVGERVKAATLKYRLHGSSIEDRRDAVRNLADVLEFLRTDAKQLLTRQDEADLFEVANRFGIRHHKVDQKTDYDPEIWLPWVFYYYLATIHALVEIKNRTRVTGGNEPSGTKMLTESKVVDQ